MRKKPVNTMFEPARIADQLRRAFDGDAWHGPALLELLDDVDAAPAAAKPLPDVHSIWELVLHVAVWDGAALVRLSGEKCQPEGAANFPPVTNATAAAWRRAVRKLKRTHQTLVKTVAALPDSRLRERVPGKRYDFYHMLHGIAQHELYHAGQIAILKKAHGGRDNGAFVRLKGKSNSLNRRERRVKSRVRRENPIHQDKSGHSD